MARETDSVLGRTKASEYDVSNQPMRITHMEGSDHLYTGQVEYDEYNNLKSFREEVGADRAGYRTDFTYDSENKPTKLTYGSANDKVNYTYDAIGRMKKRTVTVGGTAYAASYTYIAGNCGDGNTTPLVSKISQTGETCVYTYDGTGNIQTEKRNGVQTSYVYDGIGQLIRVNDPNDTAGGETGTTWVYEYDRSGNMLNKKRYAYTTGTLGSVLDTITYTYGDSGWKDKMTAYNGTTPLTYDAIGNPVTYGGWTYTWEKGRQLKRMEHTNGKALEFDYNSEGLRVRKVDMKKMLYILIFIMSCSFCISSYPGICELEIEVNEEYKSHVISSFGLKKTTYLRYALMPEPYHMLYCLLAIELAYPGVERAQYIESLNRENIIYNVCATSDESILQLAFSLNIYLYLYHDPIDRAEIIYRYQGNTVHAEVDLSMTNKSLSKYGTEIYDELERIMLSPVQDAPEVTDSAVLTALSASPYDRLYQAKDNIDEYELLFLQMLCINCACQGMTRNQIKQLLESFPAFRDNIWINNVSISVDIEPYSLFFVTNYEDQITHASLSVMPERWLYTEEAQQEGYFLLPTFYILMDDTYMTNSLQ